MSALNLPNHGGVTEYYDPSTYKLHNEKTLTQPIVVLHSYNKSYFLTGPVKVRIVCIVVSMRSMMAATVEAPTQGLLK